MRITGTPKQGEHSITLDAGEFHALKHLLKTEQDSKQLEFEENLQGFDMRTIFSPERRIKSRRSPPVSRRSGTQRRTGEERRK